MSGRWVAIQAPSMVSDSFLCITSYFYINLIDTFYNKQLSFIKTKKIIIEEF